jgi:hypothetical protein
MHFVSSPFVRSDLLVRVPFDRQTFSFLRRTLWGLLADFIVSFALWLLPRRPAWVGLRGQAKAGWFAVDLTRERTNSAFSHEPTNTKKPDDALAGANSQECATTTLVAWQGRKAKPTAYTFPHHATGRQESSVMQNSSSTTCSSSSRMKICR